MPGLHVMQKGLSYFRQQLIYLMIYEPGNTYMINELKSDIRRFSKFAN